MDEQGLPQGFEAPTAEGDDTAPTAGMISQYVKDLSFENPNAPAIYQAQTAPASTCSSTSRPCRSVRTSTN